jgi:hypothetical protein
MLWLYCEEGAMHTAINSLVPVSPDVRRWIYGIAWHMVTRVKGKFASWQWKEANLVRFP